MNTFKHNKFFNKTKKQVRALLDHAELDVNRRNNDRLTSFMLAMQGGPLGMAARMGHQVSSLNFVAFFLKLFLSLCIAERG
jgi:hypothetical protein